MQPKFNDHRQIWHRCPASPTRHWPDIFSRETPLARCGLRRVFPKPFRYGLFAVAGLRHLSPAPFHSMQSALFVPSRIRIGRSGDDRKFLPMPPFAFPLSSFSAFLFRLGKKRERGGSRKISMGLFMPPFHRFCRMRLPCVPPFRTLRRRTFGCRYRTLLFA